MIVSEPLPHLVNDLLTLARLDDVQPLKREYVDLIELATQERVVLMCAEAVPWRCHRSLIADGLLVRGVAVREITSGTERPAAIHSDFVRRSAHAIHPKMPSAIPKNTGFM